MDNFTIKITGVEESSADKFRILSIYQTASGKVNVIAKFSDPLPGEGGFMVVSYPSFSISLLSEVQVINLYVIGTGQILDIEVRCQDKIVKVPYYLHLDPEWTNSTNLPSSAKEGCCIYMSVLTEEKENQQEEIRAKKDAEERSRFLANEKEIADRLSLPPAASRNATTRGLLAMGFFGMSAAIMTAYIVRESIIPHA